ncbi:MAG: protein kinase family protein, partial [Pseudonocardiaceae bacterium]
MLPTNKALEDVVTQVRTPAQGELLAGRYRLDTIVEGNQDNGYSLWHGTDGLLSRDVSIELRVPGGESAKAMISGASRAGRVSHASIMGVYDAVDEGDRAFVVREWVVGRTLTEVLVTDGPFDAYRAAGLARTAADAIAAIHSTGMAHGRLDPGTVLLTEDGELTFTDLELCDEMPPENDIRAIGGLLYAALTGAWPLEASATFRGLPEAVRVDGRLCTPRQLRAGIPSYLDALAMDLLDPSVSDIDAATLAQELRRYDIADPDLGPLTTIAAEPVRRPAAWKRFGIPIAGVACILAAGLAVGTVGLPDISGSNYPLSNNADSGSGQKQVLRTVNVSVLDPQGDGTETEDADKAIDNQPNTAWEPDAYRRANFG